MYLSWYPNGIQDMVNVNIHKYLDLDAFIHLFILKETLVSAI